MPLLQMFIASESHRRIFKNALTWKYNNTRNTISFSVSKMSFIFLMTPIDFTNDQNIFVELFEATYTH